MLVLLKIFNKKILTSNKYQLLNKKNALYNNNNKIQMIFKKNIKF